MNINFNQLDQRIVLQDVKVITDDLGDNKHLWYDVMEIWASIEPVSTAHFVNKINSARRYSTHQVRIRHNPHLTNNMRILYNNRIFEIAEIITPAENSRYQLINTVELL